MVERTCDQHSGCIARIVHLEEAKDVLFAKAKEQEDRGNSLKNWLIANLVAVVMTLIGVILNLVTKGSP